MTPKTCPNCSRDKITVAHPRDYRYQGAGLENVRLHGGVTIVTCRHCSEVSVRIEKEWQLLQVIALSLLMAPRYLGGPEIRYLRTVCGLTQEQMASRVKSQRRATIAEREAGKHVPMDFGNEILYRLVYLKAFQELLRKPGENHLAAPHEAILDRLSSKFGDLAEGIKKSGKGQLELFQDHNVWKQKAA